MFEALALVLSFALWKVLFVAFWVLSICWIPIVIFTSQSEIAFDSKKVFAICVLITLVCWIPYLSFYTDTFLYKLIVKQLLEPWSTYTKKIEVSEAEQKAEKPYPIYQPQELRRYELVGWNPPTHFYVTLEDVETHVLHKNIYVSKHCNMGALVKGDEYNINVVRYTMSNAPDVELVDFKNLPTTFCE